MNGTGNNVAPVQCRAYVHTCATQMDGIFRFAIDLWLNSIVFVVVPVCTYRCLRQARMERLVFGNPPEGNTGVRPFRGVRPTV